MPHTLALTNGTTTVNLLGTVAYLVEGGWSPAVAPRRRSELGNQGDYENVVEEMTINLVGATGLTVLRQINLLLDEGRRWWLGDPSASPVRLQARPDNSVTGVTLESPVYGTPDGAPIELPRSFHDYLKTQEVNAITLRFVRNGLWYNPTPESITSSNVLPSATTSVTFSNNIPTLSPVDIGIVPTSDIGGIVSVYGTVLYGQSTSDFVFHETFLTGSSVATGSARGGSVWRVTLPGANTEQMVTSSNISGLPSTRVHVYVACKANTTACTVRATASAVTSLYTFWNSSIVDVTNTSVPSMISLGSIDMRGITAIDFRLYVQSTNASATLDIDYLVFQADKGSLTGAFEFVGGDGGLGNPSNRQNAITIINDPIEYTSPYVYRHAGNNQFASPTRPLYYFNGNMHIQSNSTTMAFVPFVYTGSTGYALDSSRTATMTVTARRYAAYLTLE